MYRSAINHEPDLAEPHNNLAGILARRGSYAEAIYEYESAIKDDPRNAQIRLNYSIVLANTGAFGKAAVKPEKPYGSSLSQHLCMPISATS